jgi:hypothetical protein
MFLHVSAPERAILRELKVILMKVLIHKGGGERSTKTVCGCVQLKDPSVNNHLDISTEHIHRRSRSFVLLRPYVLTISSGSLQVPQGWRFKEPKHVGVC